MPTLAYIAMGSNIEPKATHLDQAAERLQQQFPAQFRRSAWYLSQPYQNLEQGAYLNGACCFATDLSAPQLLEQLLQIERELGRVRTDKKWDNRTLDLDIALFGDQIIKQPHLTIPHYDLEQRDFFLVPLTELNAQLRNPRSGALLSWHLAQIAHQDRTDLHQEPPHA